MSRLGDKIRIAMERKKISRKIVAKKLGVSEKFLLDVETGRKVMDEKMLDRLSKLLGQDINDISMSAVKEDDRPAPSPRKAPTSIKSDSGIFGSLGSIIQEVPIHDFNLSKNFGTIGMPIVSNKIEGHKKDKVFFLKVDTDDLLGFRIAKGDLVFCNLTGEFLHDSLYLVEYNGERLLRQVKKLDQETILLVKNSKAAVVDKARKKEVKILAKLNWAKVTL